MMDGKDVLRKNMLKKRKSMKEADAKEYSEKIISELKNQEIFQKSRNIMIYLSFNNEVDTYNLMEYCLKRGKKIIVPFTIKKERQIIPSEVRNPHEELILNSLGYKEPDIKSMREVNVENIDLVIVPGVVFDIDGNRIGFGGGYYDRFLKRLRSSTMTIALCYDYQVVDKVPVDQFDMPVKCIITEKRII
ncbi:5-formyltetrahydrofolate cyclo-ligase [Maledivibacter halophilus]|uniref:5-formyltetrahydrofolate cyclo-ligase n=1 Tax=Maledivibacter halophilus TaxID=36842 RepID=A0A1T5MT69_9FIRM|nr:5-formyltetrahydrofolate cyclo-ligase [Maledivibacter halophilus]SKC91416.1 5-formyltetrahydrofolate cyclo-ligase [Maledivibacter halophilus]